MIKKFLLLLTVVLFVLSSCSPPPAPTPTPTILPALTHVPTVTPLPSTTPTPDTQIHGRVFQEGFDSIGVSCNINTGNLNSQNTHFDIRVPEEFWHNSIDCPVYSPADGTIWEIASLDEAGEKVIRFYLSKKPKGIDRVLEQLEIDPKNVTRYGFHIGHLIRINESLKIGDNVEKGTLLSEGVCCEGWPEPGIAYVIYIWYDTKIIQISPCSVENTASFCGVCYQYEGYCHETDLNFPEGGIEWWDERDSFWDTHELSLHEYAN